MGEVRSLLLRLFVGLFVPDYFMLLFQLLLMSLDWQAFLFSCPIVALF